MDGPHEMMNPMEGQITFTMVAVATAVGYALDMFKWRADRNGVSYYAYGDAAWNNGTNWWKIYNMIGCYAGLALWSVAAITQLLSMGGIAADINLMVWGYGLGGVGALVSVIVALLQFYAKWSSFTIANDATKSAAEIAGASSTYGMVKSEQLEMAAYGAMVSVELLSQYKNWMAAQWMALPEETRMQWEEEMHGEKSTMEEMVSLLGF